jgi:hypothetical protein
LFQEISGIFFQKRSGFFIDVFLLPGLTSAGDINIPFGSMVGGH